MWKGGRGRTAGGFYFFVVGVCNRWWQSWNREAGGLTWGRMRAGGRRGLCWKGFWREILPSSLCGGGVWSAGDMRGSGWPALVGKVGCVCLCDRGGEKGREGEGGREGGREREREGERCIDVHMYACLHT